MCVKTCTHLPAQAMHTNSSSPTFCPALPPPRTLQPPTPPRSCGPGSADGCLAAHVPYDTDGSAAVLRSTPPRRMADAKRNLYTSAPKSGGFGRPWGDMSLGTAPKYYSDPYDGGRQLERVRSHLQRALFIYFVLACTTFTMCMHAPIPPSQRKSTFGRCVCELMQHLHSPPSLAPLRSCLRRSCVWQTNHAGHLWLPQRQRVPLPRTHKHTRMAQQHNTVEQAVHPALHFPLAVPPADQAVHRGGPAAHPGRVLPFACSATSAGSTWQTHCASPRHAHHWRMRMGSSNTLACICCNVCMHARMLQGQVPRRWSPASVPHPTPLSLPTCACTSHAVSCTRSQCAAFQASKWQQGEAVNVGAKSICHSVTAAT